MLTCESADPARDAYQSACQFAEEQAVPEPPFQGSARFKTGDGSGALDLSARVTIDGIRMLRLYFDSPLVILNLVR
jgi:hypothetical protein